MGYSHGFLHVFAIALVMFSGSVSSEAAKLVDQNICILEHMGNTRSQTARTHISSACNFLSLHSASLMLNREERAYSQCVLKFLTGVESNTNALELARSCRQLVWDGVEVRIETFSHQGFALSP